MSTLLKQIESKFKEAVKNKDKLTVSVLRMVKSKIQQKRTEPRFSGELTDEVVAEVVASYYKQLEKSAKEYESYDNERAKEQAEQIRKEMEVLKPFMPKLLSEEETERIVKEAISAVGATSVKQVGKVMGYIMGKYKGKINPQLAKDIATRELSE